MYKRQVPARLNSSRLPNKVLADIGGKPMLQRVLEQCKKAIDTSKIVLCTDSEKLSSLAKNLSINSILTSESCDSGTDRIASVIDKLIEMSDIVGIIGTYVDLRQSSGQYRSKCPFHDGDNITTFSVSPQKGIYHCFKCNEGGNVISFLMKYLSLDFIEAVEKLAEINHVEIPRTATKQGPDNSLSLIHI